MGQRKIPESSGDLELVSPALDPPLDSSPALTVHCANVHPIHEFYFSLKDDHVTNIDSPE